MLANRALKLASIDLETFVASSLENKMSEAALQKNLINDLETEGPIFGKFLRNLTGAAPAATQSAHRAGIRAGEIADAADSDPEGEIARLVKLNNTDIGEIIDSGDPDALDELMKMAAPVIDLMWVAELVNTCELCLPLHGVVRTAEEWAEKGLDPETIHPAEWNRDCQCRLIDVTKRDRKADMEPLVRIPQKTAGGKSVSRRTVRSIAQKDLDKSLVALEKAKQTVAGRRAIREMGKANQGKKK
jgi:hypothetical protein